jgi:peroxisomal 2,4-dienoyl-CoA reductase
VCGIAPGPIAETEGVRRLAPGGATAQIAAAIPAGRFGGIDEIAAAAVFLRSAAARYITGHTLVVDGGHSIARQPLGLAP